MNWMLWKQENSQANTEFMNMAIECSDLHSIAACEVIMKRVNFLIESQEYAAFKEICEQRGFSRISMLQYFTGLAMKDNHWLSVVEPFSKREAEDSYSIFHYNMEPEQYLKFQSIFANNKKTGMGVSGYIRGCIKYVLSDPEGAMRILMEKIPDIPMPIPEIEPVSYSKATIPQIRISKEMLNAVQTYTKKHNLINRELFSRLLLAVIRDASVLDRFQNVVADTNRDSKVLIGRVDMEIWTQFRTVTASRGMTASTAIRRFLAVLVVNPDFDYHTLE